MKNLILFLMLVFVVSCATKPDVKEQNSKTFDFYVTQNEKRVEPANGEIILKKAPFKIIFNLYKKTGIYINLSFNKTGYDLAARKARMNEILEKDGIWMGGAEYAFNGQNDFFLQNDQYRWQYWYYENARDSRFNSVRYNSGVYICTRVIENFYYEKKEAKINEYPYQKLYIVVTHVIHDKNYQNFREIQTEKIILNFIE